jgi:uroporphyrinogen-III synthase
VSLQQSTTSLQGLNILVTRPEKQAQVLCDLIEARGGKAVRFPVLEISDPADPSSIKACLERINEYDLGIFISANAVSKLFQYLDTKNIVLPNRIKLAVIGKGTKRLLDDKDIKVDICPEEHFNSEELLAMDTMQQVKGKRVVIFKGEGGRNLLETTLKERGAIVDNMELYKRAPVNTEPAPILQRWKNNELQIVTATSNEGLQALFDIVGSEGREYLRNTPLVIISERMREKATELGFQADIKVTSEASNEGILKALEELATGH